MEDNNGSPPGSPDKMRTSSLTQAAVTSGSKTTLTILTCAAVVAIFAPVGSHATIALGLSYTIHTAFAFLLVGKARTEAQSGRLNGGGSVIYSANGLLSQPLKPATSPAESQMAVIRAVSATAALATGIAAFTLESFTFGGLAYWGIIGQAMGDYWVFGQGIVTVVVGVGVVGLHAVVDWVLLIMVSFVLFFPETLESAAKTLH